MIEILQLVLQLGVAGISVYLMYDLAKGAMQENRKAIDRLTEVLRELSRKLD